MACRLLFASSSTYCASLKCMLAGFGLLCAIRQYYFKILTLSFHYRVLDKCQRGANTGGHPEQKPSISNHKFH